MTHPSRHNRRITTAAALTTLALSTLLLAGCNIIAAGAVLAEEIRRQGSSTIQAEYEGIQDKSFAAVVIADRAIQSDHPNIAARLTDRTNRLLHDNAEGQGWIPPADLLAYLYNHPAWVAWSRDRLAEELGVERLIVIELTEYRLNAEGNQYEWEGIASAIVEVYEADSVVPDEPAYSQLISVAFPDNAGVLTEQISRRDVTSVLSLRLSNRAAWLFYDHSEPNMIAY